MIKAAIVKVQPVSAVDQKYRTNGVVHRVFDTNGTGDLIPVSFNKHPFNNFEFSLQNITFGQVYAEVTYF